MLIGGLIVVVVVLGVIAAVLLTRRSHDDVHSVEHYHRQLHTLEEIRGHPVDAANGSTVGEKVDKAEGEVFPASAFRVSGSSTVRLTGSDQPPVPPVPPPPVANPSKPLTFDDASPDPVPVTFMTGNEDRVIRSIDHRPRRLGGPAAAVGAVLVLVLVLILTGLHSNSGKHHGKSATAPTTATTHPATTQHRHETTTTTSTTAPPSVSAPSAATSHTASYTVSDAAYSLNIAATTGECWVDVTNTATGAVLFTTTLQSGQSHTIAASGPVTVIAGAPGAFAATVDGAAVTLPPGNQAPFTLNFLTASSAGGTTSPTTTSTT
ncbi:MAG TPA: DUF4115 domain-containing protein [Acidimicrobiales bacterium]